MKKFLTLVTAAVIGVGIALSAPVKNVVGAKQSHVESETGWQNPYVTDGLVAMWDGEWNAGFGTHDPDAVVWKDLVGDNDMDVAESSVFGNNYLLNAANTDGAVSQRFANDARTVEVVMRVGGYYMYYNCPFIVVNCIDRHSYRGIGKRYEGFTNGLLEYYVRTTEWRGTTTFNASFYLGGLWRDLNTYFNGEARTVIDTTHKLSYEITNNATYVHAGQYAVEFYTIRLYNRALTEEEVQYNYAVDAERFGL